MMKPQPSSSRKPTEVLLLMIAIALPFEFIPTHKVFGLTVKISTVLGSLLITLIALDILKNRIPISKLGSSQKVLLIWLMWLTASFFWSPIKSDWYRAFLPLLFLILLAFAVSLTISISKLLSLVKMIFVGAFLSSIFGIYQFIGNYEGLSKAWTGLRDEYSWQRFGFPRMQSTALEPLYYSAYLLLPISIIVGLAKAKILRSDGLKIGLVGLLLLVDFLTLSRGGLAALVICMIIIFSIRAIHEKAALSKQLLIGAAGFVAVFLVGLVVIAVVAKNGQDNRLTYGKRGDQTVLAHLTNFHFIAGNRNKANNDSIAQRQTARGQAISVLEDHPKVLLFGTGLGQYHNFVRAHYLTQDYGEPNNIVLEQILLTGLVGFGILVAFIFGLILRLYKLFKYNSDKLVANISLSLVAYFLALGIQAQTFTGLLLTHFWFAIGLALFLVQLPIDKKVDSSGRQKKVTKIRTN